MRNVTRVDAKSAINNLTSEVNMSLNKPLKQSYKSIRLRISIRGGSFRGTRVVKFPPDTILTIMIIISFF